MKFSIVTVTYNSERTLRDTFESVIKQSYRPLQYIIVDGLSTDSTMDIVREYEDKFLKAGIEFIYSSEKDKGISDAFNKGIERADGDIVGIINSDDMLYDEALSTIATHYSDEIDVYYGECVIIKFGDQEKYIAKPKSDLNRLYWAMCLFHPACFVRKSTYVKYGSFDVNLKYCMDRELMLRFFVDGCIFKEIESPLACYREGGVNQTNYRKNLKEGIQISVKYGMSPWKAKYYAVLKYCKVQVWHIVSAIGAERLIHKKV